MPTLNWLTRGADEQAAGRVPYRLLEPVAELSTGDPAAENLIIQGDNLDAVKAITPYFAGRVKCFAIDPPYNTRSAFEHYDDNLEHSTWLSMMYPRLELMRDLLAEDGSIWVCIDDNEAHYLKVIMDEVFGRKNFVANVVWQKRTSPDARIDLGDAHDSILVYGRDSSCTAFNRVMLDPSQDRGSGTPTKILAVLGHQRTSRHRAGDLIRCIRSLRPAVLNMNLPRDGAGSTLRTFTKDFASTTACGSARMDVLVRG